jgi:hypothetical protein
MNVLMLNLYYFQPQRTQSEGAKNTKLDAEKLSLVKMR